MINKPVINTRTKVSSLNEYHEIDTSSRVRKTEHMRLGEICQAASPRWRPHCEIGKRYLRDLPQNSERSPSSNAIKKLRNNLG